MANSRVLSFIACLAGLHHFHTAYGQSGTCPAGQKCGDGTQHFLLIGNPGVGKSTILNGLAGKTLYKSGPAYGPGLTTVLQEERVGNRIYMDTPGLADIKMRKQAAQEITAALRRGGEFKVFFVVTLEAGRVRPEQKTTIKLVLESAPITDYAIIINKLEPEELEEIVTDAEARDAVLAGFMTDMPQKTLYFHWALRHDYLSGKKMQALQLDDEFRQFLETVPSVFIPSEAVKDIKADEFERLNAQFESMIAKMNEDKEFVKELMKKDRDQFEQMIKRMQEENVRLSRKLDEAMRKRK
jgi:GTPase Era involved in 16S rRNA processing